MTNSIKLIVFLFGLSFGVSVAAGTVSGKEIELLKNSSGLPSFGLQFATQTSKMIAITFSAQGSSFVGATSGVIAPAQWSIFNKQTGAQLSSWSNLNTSTAAVLPSSAQSFTVAVGNPVEIQAIIGSLKESLLVIALHDSSAQPKASVYIDISKLCETSPGSFVNLDALTTGCN